MINTNNRPTILIIEDESKISGAIRSLLNDLGCAVIMSQSHDEAVSFISRRTYDFDLILCDYNTQNRTVNNGRLFLSNRANRDIPVIGISQQEDNNLIMMGEGAKGFINKHDLITACRIYGKLERSELPDYYSAPSSINMQIEGEAAFRKLQNYIAEAINIKKQKNDGGVQL